MVSVSLGSPRRSEVAGVALWVERGEKGRQMGRGTLSRSCLGAEGLCALGDWRRVYRKDCLQSRQDSGAPQGIVQ